MKLVRRNAGFPSLLDELFTNDAFYGGSTYTPAVNIKETENSYVVDLAVPGMEKSDFEINLENNVLTISAEKATEKENTTEKYTLKEFGKFSFKRSFTLPEGKVNTENVNAQYNNGVLSILLPKQEKEVKKAKLIEIA
tara:strand:- start:766 stop:1179 length:414 start_codon:yes stop_codon:yes gene_type:complete